MRYLYTFLLYLSLPFIFLRLLWRSLSLRDYRLRFKERLGYYPIHLDKCVWVHAVSVGEVLAAIPLIKALQAQYPHLPMLVTTMTPTGSARVKAAFGDSVSHVYLPYDLPGAISRFLDAMHPQVCVIMETELWPNLLHACVTRNIPVCLTNARLSEKSARGYHRIASLTRKMFADLTQIAACQQADADRFAQLGAKNVVVTGNLKFDLVITDEVRAKGEALRQQLGRERFIWVAASTHAGEEEIILAAHKKLLSVQQDALLILVPRHPDRFVKVSALAAQEFKTQCRSKNEPLEKDTNVYLGDTMGELLVMYAAGDVALVAGSLIPRGGHNVLEPAALAKPVLTGEFVFNFAEICDMLTRAGGLVRVQDGDALAKQLIRFASDKSYRDVVGNKALDVMNANRGSLAKQLQVIRQVFHC